MKLTATSVRQAKPRGKAYKMADGQSLYLLVNKKSKYWRYDYAIGGKRKTLSLGIYPAVSLAEARKRHQVAKQYIAEGIDPGLIKKTQKIDQEIEANNTFAAVGQEWFEIKMLDKSKRHRDRCLRILKNDLNPSLGAQPVSAIKTIEVLSALRKVERRGIDASRAKSVASQVFRYAVATAQREGDPTRDLGSALRTKVVTHHASITEPKEIGLLLVAIRNYNGTIIVKTALELSALVFQRPGEIRHAEWSEINWEKKQWEISAVKMKSRKDHIVPLCRQAVNFLERIHGLTGRGKYIFPSARGQSRPLSDNAVRTALRGLGYANETMTPHGFRAMARTVLDEVLGFRVEWIEHQLAHAVKDTNGRAYNRTSHIEGRRLMMQKWGDYLDILRSQALGINAEHLASLTYKD